MKKVMMAVAAIMLTVAVVLSAGCNKQDNSNVKVTTYEPQDITQTTATIKGDVDVVVDGITVTDMGVCWGTSKNPTVSDNHMSGNAKGTTFTCTITRLEPGTKYHVRVYASNGSEFYYGTDKSFTTEGSPGGGGVEEHTWVDLGLPSGTLWATCNVGAVMPYEYGRYFAWGETEQKEVYGWNTYKYTNTNSSNNTLIKYCNKSSYGYEGFTDNLTILESGDDAATVNWGNGWHTPTKEQWQELKDYTTCAWTIQNDVYGRVFYGNGQSLFLPAAGGYWVDGLHVAGSNGYYWSSSLYTDGPYSAWDFCFDSGVYYMSYYNRFIGQSVRAVRSAK